MARVTVEDCIEKVANRFELVMLASLRARKIGSGSALLLDRENDKNTVVSLREIAEGKIATDAIKEELVRNHQRIIEMDDNEDVIDMMEGEEEWNAIAAQSASKSYEDIDDSEDLDDLDDLGSSLEDLAGGTPDDEA